jgi:hypothetical protein
MQEGLVLCPALGTINNWKELWGDALEVVPTTNFTCAGNHTILIHLPMGTRCFLAAMHVYFTNPRHDITYTISCTNRMLSNSTDFGLCLTTLKYIRDNELTIRKHIERKTIILAGVLRRRLGVCKDVTTMIARMYFKRVFEEAKEDILY